MIGPHRERQSRGEGGGGGSGGSGARRNYWGGARERHRRLARSAIKARLRALAAGPGEEGAAIDAATTGHDSGEEENDDAVASDDDVPSKEWMDRVLWHIIKGKRSYFSLACVQEHLRYFEMTHPTEYLFSADGNELIGKAQMYNWFGEDAYAVLREELRSDVARFTVLEYAVWCRRWHIVGSLLLAAVNPGVRGRRNQYESEMSLEEYNANSDLLFRFGSRVLQRFFDECVPLALSSHVLRCAVECRWSAQVGTCPVCSTRDPLLSCGGAACPGVCELCWWRNVLRRLDDLEDHLVGCAVCAVPENAVAAPCDSPQQESKSLFEESRRKYMALPADMKEHRERAAAPAAAPKPEPPREDGCLVSSWSSAILSSMGPTREIRRDRYFIRITKGHYHYIRGFLVHGIDLNLANEYGQTGLYIAAWLGHTRIIQLLLEHGADPYLEAHGGSTAWSAAQANGRDDVLCILADHGVMKSDLSWRTTSSIPDGRRWETLIDLSVDHPGAGSFYIDDAVSEETIEDFVRLWRSTPIERDLIKQKKNKKCSDRSYFCDAEGTARRALSSAILGAFGDMVSAEELVVLPHMRFLSYSEPGTVLLPHTDLHRVDLFSGIHSTHTFILYLTTCETGGETVLLGHTHGPERDRVLASIAPRRGRLLLFPHLTPHEGKEVTHVPKLLIRGEVILQFT